MRAAAVFRSKAGLIMRPNPEIAEAYESIGLPPALREQYHDVKSSPSTSESDRGANVASAMGKVHELTAELGRLRAEREQWQAQQAEIMKLLASKSPDRIVHDLRNVLNERELFRTLADLGE